MGIYDVALFVGHGTSERDGSYDPGATHNGKQEHIIAEKIVDRAVVLCTNKGIIVHRDEQNYKDNDLSGNTYNYKYAMEVHLNAGGGRRAELYSPCAEKDLAIEFAVLAELAKLGLANGGVKSRDYDSERTFMRTNGVTLPYTDYYGVINRGMAQGVSLDILEVGFIDSEDVFIVESNIERIATIIANAMCTLCKKPLYNVGSEVIVNNPTPAPSTGGVAYRVRRTWLDPKSQLQAFNVLDNAKALCDKNPGYFVFDVNGKALYPVVVQPKPPTQQGEYVIYTKNEIGTFTCTEDLIYFRNAPYVGEDNPTQGNYIMDETVNYDSITVTNLYTWISWVSEATKIRRHMPITDRVNDVHWGTCE